MSRQQSLASAAATARAAAENNHKGGGDGGGSHEHEHETSRVVAHMASSRDLSMDDALQEVVREIEDHEQEQQQRRRTQQGQERNDDLDHGSECPRFVIDFVPNHCLLAQSHIFRNCAKVLSRFDRSHLDISFALILEHAVAADPFAGSDDDSAGANTASAATGRDAPAPMTVAIKGGPAAPSKKPNATGIDGADPDTKARRSIAIYCSSEPFISVFESAQRAVKIAAPTPEAANATAQCSVRRMAQRLHSTMKRLGFPRRHAQKIQRVFLALDTASIVASQTQMAAAQVDDGKPGSSRSSSVSSRLWNSRKSLWRSSAAAAERTKPAGAPASPLTTDGEDVATVHPLNNPGCGRLSVSALDLLSVSKASVTPMRLVDVLDALPQRLTTAAIPITSASASPAKVKVAAAGTGPVLLTVDFGKSSGLHLSQDGILEGSKPSHMYFDDPNLADECFYLGSTSVYALTLTNGLEVFVPKGITPALCSAIAGRLDVPL